MGWTVTSNLIGFVIGSLFVGLLSDSYGRKKTMFFGNLILMLGALGCAISPSINFLIFARFIQGIGAATAVVLVPVVIADVYQLDKAEKFYKIMNSILTIFTAAAPVVGGFINDIFGWKMNFTIVAVVEFVAWLLLILLFSETKKDAYKKFHIVTMLKDFKIVLSHRIFLLSMFASNLLWVCYLVFITYAPFVYIERFGTTASIYSVNLLIFIGFYSFSSFVAMKIRTTKTSLYIGCFLIISSFIMMFYSKSFYFITLSACIDSLGSAIVMPVIFSYSMSLIPEHKGISSSVSILLRNASIAFGIWITGLIYTGSVYSFVLPMFVFALISSLIIIYLIKSSNLVKDRANSISN
jgi:DHA1 family bicyclomycin/chloramphenicol resistance-like MFS transporter